MRTIHKTQLMTTDYQTVHMHGFVKALCVQAQRGVPCLWYETELPEASYPGAGPYDVPVMLSSYVIHMVGIGDMLPTIRPDRELVSISTVQFADGDLIFHFYMEMEK